MIRTRVVDGLRYPKTFSVEKYYLMRDLPLRPNDIILSTYPKSGTHWVSYIIWGILHPEEPVPPVNRISLDFPIVEATGLGSWKDCPTDQGRTLATHLTYDRLQKNPSTKYVVICRNPLDTCVSFYHFLKILSPVKDTVEGYEEEENITLDTVFGDYMRGDVAFGDFFSHVKCWYNLRNQENVCFLVYEKLKENPKREILKLARFLGHEQKLEGNNCRLLDKIVEQSSFSAMKKNLEYHHVYSLKVAIMRKGESGSYRDTLSPRQVEKLKEKMEKELKGTELLECWKDV